MREHTLTLIALFTNSPVKIRKREREKKRARVIDFVDLYVRYAIVNNICLFV